MRTWTALFAVTLALASVGPAAAQAPARNVVVITLDGLRWQEMFTGADRDYFKKNSNGEPAAAEKRFWRATPEERRAALMPFVWSTIATKGQIFGDPVEGEPGPRDQRPVVLVSRLQRDVRGRRRSADRQQRQGAQPERHGARVAQLPSRLPGARRGVRLVGRAAVHPQHRAQPDSGRHRLHAGAERRRPIASAPSTSSPPTFPRYWDYGPFDAPIVYAALESLRTDKPRVLYIMLGEGDEWAHAGRYDLYLDATFRADRFIRRIWDTLQSMPEYKDQTTLLVTTDHGRGATTADWNDHGKKVPAAESTWMLALGPGVPPLGVRESVTVTTSQLAATIAAAVGEDFTSAVQAAAPPLPLKK